jgi:protein TonB
MTRRRPSDQRRPRWGTAAVVLLLHLVVVAALIRAFTPELAERAVRSMTRAITVTVTPPPPPEPKPLPQPAPVPRKAAPRSAGAAGAPGRKAPTRAPAIAPPVPLVVVATSPAPVAAGASASGTASGAAGTGQGVGAGSTGAGTGGGGGAMPTVKIAGEIDSARDYPRAGRDLRVGSSVVIDLSVGLDGRVRGCRVLQPSPDPEAGPVTCELATKRFRFRPARDATGNPVGAIYRWRQRWFY